MELYNDTESCEAVNDAPKSLHTFRSLLFANEFASEFANEFASELLSPNSFQIVIY